MTLRQNGIMLTLRASAVLADRAGRIARKQGLSRSEFARRAIEKAIEESEAKNGKK